MKKIFTFMLVLVLCCANTMVSSLALVPKHTNAVSSNISSDNINNSPEDQAEMLKALGFFIGTNNGFELNRNLTRAEAAVLLVRVLGEESTVLEHVDVHPFTDVPAWADRYVGWLYRNRVTYGISDVLYGSSQNVTYWQFATLLSRAYANNDDFLETGIGKKSEQSLCESNGFSRADAVGLITRFLTCRYVKFTNENITVAQYLVNKGVVGAEQFFESAVNVYPIDYSFNSDNGIVASILGVLMCESRLKGISGHSAYPATELPYFYAWQYNDDTVLYRMDCRTLEETKITSFVAADSVSLRSIEHYATVDGRDYLGVTQNGGASLICVDGDMSKTLAEGKEFGFTYSRYDKPDIQHENLFMAVLDDMVYIVTKDSVSKHMLASGAEIVAVVDNVAVLCREENGKAVIEGINIDDWIITDTYIVTLPENNSLPIIRWDGRDIYGEAGLFIVHEGRLVRATERPVLDVDYVRYGAGGAPAVLTRGPGSVIGDTIIFLYGGPYITPGDAEWVEEIRLTNNPPHGIEIAGLDHSDISSIVFFYSLKAVGMDLYDKYTYLVRNNSEEGHIGIEVLSFEPGHPEIMEHDNQWYIQQEQERLNALGYKPW